MSNAMKAMYRSHPEALAIELEMLFEPCIDASFAVLHNAIIQKVVDLCGEEVSADVAYGEPKKVAKKLVCKSVLARKLAEAVINNMRMEDVSD